MPSQNYSITTLAYIIGIMESCLLCLEQRKEAKNVILAESTRWQKFNIQQVVEKHFWPLNTIRPSSLICLSCWQEVYDFNKFYLRIEEAHISFGKVKTKEETQFLDSKDEISQENENFAYSCLEPEILIDQNILQNLNNKESSIKQEYDNNDLCKNILKKDPLEKPESIQPGNRKKLKSETTTETEKISEEQSTEEHKVKSEPDDSTDNDDSNSENDDVDDSSNQRAKKSVSKERKNQKENDKYIAEHFKQMFCDICNIPFENFRFMKEHFTSIHNQKGYLVCCGKKFYERKNLVDHLHCHIDPDYFKCTQCGKVLSDRKNFKSHMLLVHRPNDVVLKHSCEICGKSFAQGYVLRAHKLTHLPKEEKKFPCTECGKFYGSSYLLKIHTEVVHLKKHAKVCYICGKSLGTSTEYRSHMNKHEGIPAPVINCDVCGLRLTSERGLKLHKESQHPIGGKQEHPCHICHKISPTLRALRKHISTMHEKGNDHKCNICEKTFRRPETLKEHMATHTGTALYSCPWCPKTFNSNGNMHAHRKKVHPKEWEEAKLQKYSGNLLVELHSK